MSELQTTINATIEQAEAEIRKALSEQGFGVLTEIDLAATLQAKLGVERGPLKILGACNPTFAHQALEVDPSVALMLPCNVVLAAEDDAHTTITIADPREMMTGSEFAELASGAAERLSRALTSAKESLT